MLQDLELCIPACDLGAATSIFASLKDTFEESPSESSNIYTDYKKKFSRFRFCAGSDLNFVIFSDQYCHLEPLSKSLIAIEDLNANARFSDEILDTFSPTQVISLPLPKFTALFKGLCRIYMRTREITAAISAELLVDGMNVNEDWCKARFASSEYEEMRFALGLVRSKRSRISDFTSNDVTCFIADERAASNVCQIPGFD